MKSSGTACAVEQDSRWVLCSLGARLRAGDFGTIFPCSAAEIPQLAKSILPASQGKGVRGAGSAGPHAGSSVGGLLMGIGCLH